MVQVRVLFSYLVDGRQIDHRRVQIDDRSRPSIEKEILTIASLHKIACRNLASHENPLRRTASRCLKDARLPVVSSHFACSLGTCLLLVHTWRTGSERYQAD